MTIDLLYGDIEDGQSTITRFVLLPSEHDKWRYDVAPTGAWLTAVSVLFRTQSLEKRIGPGRRCAYSTV